MKNHNQKGDEVLRMRKNINTMLYVQQEWKYKVVPELPTAKAYPCGKVPINKKKLEDLRKLKEYTRGYESFYEDILQWPTTDAECNIRTDYQDE